MLVPFTARAEDAVLVSMAADKLTLVPGQTTTVRVFGQISPLVDSADQIFSWYIDIHNDDGSAVAGYENVRKPTSDNGGASSGGTQVGDDLVGVYDFFLGHPGAGNGSQIELVSFEVHALTVGTSTFRVVPGTTGPGAFDFVVAKTTGDPAVGGNYEAAALTMKVLDPPDPDLLDPVVVLSGNRAEIAFDPIEGYAHIVQWSSDLDPEGWTDLPGGPHDSGVAMDDVTGVARRWYRVVVFLP